MTSKRIGLLPRPQRSGLGTTNWASLMPRIQRLRAIKPGSRSTNISSISERNAIWMRRTLTLEEALQRPLEQVSARSTRETRNRFKETFDKNQP